MYKNPYWLVFLGLIVVCVLGYSGKTALMVYQWSRMSQTTHPTKMKWEVIELSPDEYILKVAYTFESHRKEIENIFLLDDPVHLNRYSAEQALKRAQQLSPRHVVVYYDPSNSVNASLKRQLPTKRIAYTVVLLGIAIYFAILGVYFARQARE